MGSYLASSSSAPAFVSPALWTVNVQAAGRSSHSPRVHGLDFSRLGSLSVPSALLVSLRRRQRQRRRHASRALQDILGTSPETSSSSSERVEVSAPEQLLQQLLQGEEEGGGKGERENQLAVEQEILLKDEAYNVDKELMAQQEPKEPALVVEIREDLVVVRNGFGLWQQDKPGIWVVFEDGAKGVLITIKEDLCVICLLEGEVMEGETVRRTSKQLKMRYGRALRGRILDARGDPVDGLPWPDEWLQEQSVLLDEKPMQMRSPSYRGLVTGVMGVDAVVPIGRGQTMLFQGTDREKDRKYLWPDLMCSKIQCGQEDKDLLNVCVCRDLAEAKEMRSVLQARGVWEHCAIFVPTTGSFGEGTLAIHAAMTFCEMSNVEENTEATVLTDFEKPFEVFNTLQQVAGKERAAKGVLCDPKEEKYVSMHGTIVAESIAERRRFWFAIVSRANNSKDGGSVTLLPWLWEQQGGFDYRKWQAFQNKLEEINAIPRISDETREKVIAKVKEQAKADGIFFESGVADESALLPSGDGVPNWEIEEMKSIADGHVLLKPPSNPEAWSWSVNMYNSLARLGTDALHSALISTDVSALRLRMLQGRDSARLLHQSRGEPMLNDTSGGLELEFAELLLEQPMAKNLSIAQEAARVIIVSDPDNKRLRGPDNKPSLKNLEELTEELLSSAAGEALQEEIQAAGIVTNYTLDDLRTLVATWR